MHTIDLLLAPYEEGQRVAFASGRALADLHVNPEGRLRPLLDTLSAAAFERHGMALLRFSLAAGLEWRGAPGADRPAVEAALRAAGAGELLRTGGASRLPTEGALEVLRALGGAVREGRSLPPLLLVFAYAEHLFPAESSSEATLQLEELAEDLACDYGLRGQPVYVLFQGEEAAVDPRLLRVLPHVHLPLPDAAEKRRVLRALQASPVHTGARWEPGLDEATVAHLTAGTPNASLERDAMAAARTGRPVTAARLVESKRADVLRLSDGLLTLLDTARVRGTRLVGRTIAPALGLIRQWAEGLRAGCPLTPANVIFAGSASTGKSDLCLIAAALGQVPAYRLASPKGSLVGETERNAQRQLRLMLEMAPCLGMVDEITETFSTQRDETNLDSGASRSVVGALLEALADRTREGRCLLVANTNRPQAIDPALASRFIFVPVLSPVREDLPAILVSLAEGLGGDAQWSIDDPRLNEAAEIFHEKGLMPRVMRREMAGAVAVTRRPLDPELVLLTARDACEAEPAARVFAEYTDLWALRLTSSRRLFPWGENPAGFPLPAHLKAIVRADGTLDGSALSARIAELAPYAKI